MTTEKTKAIFDRLEYFRLELREERISYEELAELQSLAWAIEEGDVELLEAAGVPEFPMDQEQKEHSLFCHHHHKKDYQ